MGQEKRSGVQKLFTGMFSPSTAADMEAHSRAWMLQCPKCGYERSIWDMGGIRYKATGKSRNYMRCVSCGERSWHKMYKREGPLPEVPASSYAAGRPPRWQLWVLLLGIVAVATAVIALCALGIVFLTASR
jgi:predicted RNA-binding Zn-ribbon protein involved in translation (DUF1610 family)